MLITFHIKRLKSHLSTVNRCFCFICTEKYQVISLKYRIQIIDHAVRKPLRYELPPFRVL